MTYIEKRSGMNGPIVESIVAGFVGITSTAVVLFNQKIIAFVFGVSYINPQAKEFAMDLAPFLGIATGLATLIWFIYKIILAHLQVKRALRKKDDVQTTDEE